ncbi:hypothetical protein [Anaerorhabdus sp.]|uniref:hypothetical protein n=1 Tax=Anaerorhabdus sp. TaxID=1872524 RepID=UPI002FCA925E
MKKHSKIHISFYKGLGQTFLVLIAISSFFLGLLWIGLNYYESTTPNGALIHYIDLLEKKQYNEIYDESKKVYAQYNEKETYVDYLKSFYGDLDLSKATFEKQNYNSTEFEYYDMLIDGSSIATIEIKKDADKNKWNARTLTNVHSYKIDTPTTDLQMVVNDNLIGSDRIVAKDTPSVAYANLKDQEQAPLITQYFIDNLIGDPNIDVQNSDYVLVKDAILDQYYAGPVLDAETLSEYEELIKTVATTYCMYITEDATFNSLRKLMYTKTEFYDAIRSFNNAYFSAHDRIEFENMNVFDVVEISEDGFIGSVSFDYIVYIGERSQTYSSTYQLTFLKVNGKWLLSNLVIAEAN